MIVRPPIADTSASLTPAWLTEALRYAGLVGSQVVVGVAASPIGTGQMCDSFRLRLQYDQSTGAPSSVVAKIPATDETSRATAKSLRSYENEVRFYEQLAPNLPIRTPIAYYADIDVETASFVLLLEDMAPASQGDQILGCSAAWAKVAVDELVKLHAPRWNDPSLASLEWLHRDKAAHEAFLQRLLPRLWDGFRTRYAADIHPDVHEAGEALFANLAAYFASDSGPATIIHGDYRLDNLLFNDTSDELRVTVVDWQTCAHGAPLNDVAYVIAGSFDPATRRAEETDLVRSYHDGLQAAGVTDYDWDQCWRDYRRASWFGLIMAVAASMLVERTTRGDEMFAIMALRHARHALDLDAPTLLLSAV